MSKAKKPPLSASDLGQLYNDNTCKVPMYSFMRPAWYVWQGLIEGMRDRGFTDKQIVEYLQSKATRWDLDGQLGSLLLKLGREYSKDVELIES